MQMHNIIDNSPEFSINRIPLLCHVNSLFLRHQNEKHNNNESIVV